ncbi:MAG TPA: WD40 repeat domain-containing protein [Trichocoleus sp.]|jgi:WD40 repeat protein
MTNSASFDSLLPSQGNTNLEQSITGDRNQTIGQVLGGMVVYVSGGQAVFNTGRDESETDAKPAFSIGPNPYRGLMAFQETDGDRFFGREKQIVELWAKLRQLHETESAIRLLPIYGPSGSGKSSLARAGLIPELARRPIPGYDRARVAVLVPGTHPLESLATVLARIATNDLIPVTKTREFAMELAQKTQSNQYDGLRRIANVLPDITISPLIVLVDQFEEVYTLCESQEERDAFIANLLCAVSDRARRVSVIMTLRSDFLGETQKHPILNTLFAEQGFLVRSMNVDELRQAIAKPAELAGHPLDQATIDLLVKDTEGREGALPLLQFALTSIWKGLTEGKEPAETLKAIGGVGGALAGEAQRVYQQLNDEEQEIARRIFLGLVQLGEGTKDTRRRVRFDSLVSYQNQPEQVKRVIELFSAPGARLITLAAMGNTETAEVSHEALFDHWQQLQTWLESSRSDIRFQRRLDEAARYWDEQGRPEGNLWRSPDLDLLKRYQQRSGDDMTPLQMAFFEAAKDTENHRKQKEQQQHRFQRWAIRGLTILSIGALGLVGIALYQLQRLQRQRVEQLATTAAALVATKPVEAEINAIAAIGLGQSTFVHFPNHPLPVAAFNSLLKTTQENRETIIFQSESPISSTAVSPDSKTVAIGMWDKTIRLLDINTGKPFGLPLSGHKQGGISVAFSPDGKRIVSGSYDNTVRLWDVRTGKPIGQPLRGHGDVVTSVAFSPDGKQIASGSYDNTVRLWDVRTGKPIGQPLRGHEKPVTSVVFSPDSKMIVSGSQDTTVRLWSISTGKSINLPIDSNENVESVAFSPDGKMIASGSWDKTVRLWDTNTGKPIGLPFRGHEDVVTSVAFSPDSKMIASGSWDKTVRLWDVRTSSPIDQPLRGYEDAIYSVAFSPDGRFIVGSSSGGFRSPGTIYVWDISTSKFVGQPLHGHERWVTSVAFSPDGRTIASSSSDGIRLWDASGNPIAHPLNKQDVRLGNPVVFNPNSETVIGVIGDALQLWSRKTSKLIRQIPLKQGYGINRAAFSFDGKTIVTTEAFRTLRLWDISTGKPIGKSLNVLQGEFVQSFAVSSDRKIIIGMEDGSLRLWNVETGKPIGQPLRGHEDPVGAVAFSRDGKMIVSGSWDTTIRLWDVKTGKPIGQPLRGHEGSVDAVAFSPDGKTVASGSNDNTVRLWDAKTGEPIGYPLRGHEGSVNAVAFSPDSKTVASGGNDNTVRLWSIARISSWQGLLQLSCGELRYHPALIEPKNDTAREAKRSCQQYAWKNQ